MNKIDKKVFCVLFFAIFNAVLGAGIVIPLLPVYAHNLGTSGIYISMIFGSFSISRTFFLPYFGKTSDIKGRKPFIVAGLFCYTIVSLCFLFSSTVNSLIVIRFFQGIASAMIMPVAQAYIGDLTPKGKEGFIMGIFNTSIFISLSLGPLIGGFINSYFNQQTTFMCMGILAVIAFLTSLIMLPPTKSEIVVKKSNEQIVWTKILRNKIIAGIFIFRLTYTICIAIIWCFLPVFADSEFSLSSHAIGILITTGVFISGLLNTPIGYMADYFNKKILIITGGLIVAVSIFSIIWSDGFWYIFGSIAVFGIGGGLSMSPLMAFAVIEGNKLNALGSVMGIMTFAQSLGMLIGSIIAGLAMDFLKLRYAFPIGSIIMMAGIIVFILCLKKITIDNFDELAKKKKMAKQQSSYTR